ncbi:HCaRG protein (macronuclear) [Tetrahymena thermophila SB210]|uniref:HCaRG protein n=1 Tax=Tetrahymena thermophila (strain SB210) TaxID=312017 RepID=I7MJH7_TETTS|nr:HCaRG protein [Tetrahymena thermophila SB210]EAR96360.2 HCaRG protein [Tetrahymena thermophila SB210]|eukprot:XP_001016605.2 HCaRG protein [Tetrahymena thermophila SB210]
MENFALNIDIIRGINISNKIPKALFIYIIEQIIKFTKNQNNEFEKTQLTELCLTEAPELKEEEVHSVLDSFVNISRFGSKKGLTAKNMQSFLKENTMIDEERMSIFVSLFQSQINEQNIVKMINLGKLIDMKWNVCSFLSDQKNKEINKIYVKLELTVQTSTGEVIHDQFALSLQEFKAFKEIISEISVVSEQYNV